MYLQHLQGSRESIHKGETTNDLAPGFDRYGKPLLIGVEPKSQNAVARMRSGYGPKPLPKEHEAMWSPGDTKGRNAYDKNEDRIEHHSTEPLYTNDAKPEGTGIHVNKYPVSGGYHSTGKHPEVRMVHEKNTDMNVPVSGARGDFQPAKVDRVIMRDDMTLMHNDVHIDVGEKQLEQRTAQLAPQRKERESVAPFPTPAMLGSRNATIGSTFTLHREDTTTHAHPTPPVEVGKPIQSTVQSSQNESKEMNHTSALSGAKRGEQHMSGVADRKHILSMEDQKIVQAAVVKPMAQIGEYTLAQAREQVDHMMSISVGTDHPSRIANVHGADDLSHAITGGTDRARVTTERNLPNVKLLGDEALHLPKSVHMPRTNVLMKGLTTLKEAALPSRTPTTMQMSTRPALRVKAMESRKKQVPGVLKPFVNLLKGSTPQRPSVRYSKSDLKGTPTANATGIQQATSRPAVSVLRADDAPAVPTQNVLGRVKAMFQDGHVQLAGSSKVVDDPTAPPRMGAPVQALHSSSKRSTMTLRTANGVHGNSHPPMNNQQVAIQKDSSLMRELGGGMAMNSPMM